MIDLRLHLPAGAQKKDGPSAGVAMVCSPPFLSGFGAKLTVGVAGLCDCIPFDGEVCTSYDCYDRRGAQKSVPPYARANMSDVCLQITLRGRVSPVGGIKEKVLGAHRVDANRVILPWANRKDVEHDVPKEVRARIQFVFARTVREVLDAAFGPGSLPWHADAHPLVESRL